MSSVSHQAAPKAHFAESDGISAAPKGLSNDARYSRPPHRPSQSFRNCGSGWYEHGVFDVVVQLSEVELNEYETAFRERVSFSATAPQPVDLPRNRPQPVILKSKARPKACAPPHPSTIRLNWEGTRSASDLPVRHGTSVPAVIDESEDKPESPKAPAKDKKKHKGDKQEKAEKSEKGEKKKKHKDNASKEENAA